MDSALHRPLETEMKMIASASREATLRFFSQDRSYRAKGGMQPIFNRLAPKAKLAWASKMVRQDDTVIRQWDDIPEIERLYFLENFYRNASVENPFPLESALADIQMTVDVLDEDALGLYIGSFMEVINLHRDRYDNHKISDQVNFLFDGLGPSILKETMRPYQKSSRTIASFIAAINQEFSILMRKDAHRDIGKKLSAHGKSPDKKLAVPPDIAAPDSPPRNPERHTKDERTAFYKKKKEEEDARVASRVAEALALSTKAKSVKAVTATECMHCRPDDERAKKVKAAAAKGAPDATHSSPDYDDDSDY